MWDWGNYPSWKDTIWELLSEIVDERVRNAFVESPPEYVVSDDLDWLNTSIKSVHGVELDSKAFLVDRLMQHFGTLRAVHGTRTNDVKQYYRHGIWPLDPIVAHRRAQQLFLNEKHPELSHEHLTRAIDAVGVSNREGRVWFEGNELLLLSQCSHYMVYGPEYLTAIAAHLEGPRDYRKVLKEYGEPTLFRCDVPLSLMHYETVASFAGKAIEQVFQNLLDGDTFEPDLWRGASFCIRTTLPPKSIVEHYHPQGLRDTFC